jgi:hypothetical protein
MTWWREMLTRFSLMAGLSPPSTSFCEAVVNSGRPAMGRYSWLRLGSLRSRSSAWMEPVSTEREEGGDAGARIRPHARWTHHLDDGQDPGLCIVVSVSANAQVNLVGVLIATEGRHQAEQGIFGGLGDDIGVESGGSHGIDVQGDLGEAGLRGCGGRGGGCSGR